MSRVRARAQAADPDRNSRRLAGCALRSAVGLTLIGWVSVEIVVLAGLGSLAWTLYLVLGASIVAIGVAWWRPAVR